MPRCHPRFARNLIEGVGAPQSARRPPPLILRTMIELTVREDAVLLPVKVVPGASRTKIVGPLAGRLKIAVAAPPEVFGNG